MRTAKTRTIAGLVIGGTSSSGAGWSAYKTAAGAHTLTFEEPMMQPAVSPSGGGMAGTWTVYIDRLTDRSFNVRSYAGAGAADPVAVSFVAATMR